MGVDVWIRRDRIAPSAERSVAAPIVPVSQVASVATRAPSKTAAPQASDDLRIQLDCMAAPGVVIVGDFANPLDRRIAQDIAQAIAGVGADMQRAQFRWPQTQTGDAGATAAQNAYREFLRGQIERARARWLLLLGVTASSLADSNERAGDATILRLPEAHALRADPDAKKRLWLSVSRPAQA